MAAKLKPATYLALLTVILCMTLVGVKYQTDPDVRSFIDAKFGALMTVRDSHREPPPGVTPEDIERMAAMFMRKFEKDDKDPGKVGFDPADLDYEKMYEYLERVQKLTEILDPVWLTDIRKKRERALTRFEEQYGALSPEALQLAVGDLPDVCRALQTQIAGKYAAAQNPGRRKILEIIGLIVQNAERNPAFLEVFVKKSGAPETLSEEKKSEIVNYLWEGGIEPYLSVSDGAERFLQSGEIYVQMSERILPRMMEPYFTDGDPMIMCERFFSYADDNLVEEHQVRLTKTLLDGSRNRTFVVAALRSASASDTSAYFDNILGLLDPPETRFPEAGDRQLLRRNSIVALRAFGSFGAAAARRAIDTLAPIVADPDEPPINRVAAVDSLAAMPVTEAVARLGELLPVIEAQKTAAADAEQGVMLTQLADMIRARTVSTAGVVSSADPTPTDEPADDDSSGADDETLLAEIRNARDLTLADVGRIVDRVRRAGKARIAFAFAMLDSPDRLISTAGYNLLLEFAVTVSLARTLEKRTGLFDNFDPDRIEREMRLIATIEPERQLAILAKLLASKNRSVQVGVIGMIGDTGLAAAAPLLIGALENAAEVSMAEAVMFGLFRIGTPEAVAAVDEWLAKAPFETGQKLEILGRLTQMPGGRRPAVAGLLRIAESDEHEFETRRRAFEIVGRISGDDAKEHFKRALIGILADPTKSDRIRLLAIQFLSPHAIDDDAAKALKDASVSPNPALRSAAANALKRF